MDAIYVDAESHGYYGDEEPPESVVLVGENGSIEYVPAGEYHWLREFLNGIAEKCGTKDCSSLVEYVRQLEGEVDELREQVASLTDRSFRMADKMDCLNAENESLRELVRGLDYCAHEAYGMCARVPVGGERPFTCCPLYDFDAKEYRCEKLRLELGFEVR